MLYQCSNSSWLTINSSTVIILVYWLIWIVYKTHGLAAWIWLLIWGYGVFVWARTPSVAEWWSAANDITDINISIKLSTANACEALYEMYICFILFSTTTCSYNYRIAFLWARNHILGLCTIPQSTHQITINLTTIIPLQLFLLSMGSLVHY